MKKTFWQTIKERLAQADWDDDDDFVENTKPVKLTKDEQIIESNKSIRNWIITGIILILIIFLFNDFVALVSGHHKILIENASIIEKFEILFGIR